MPIQKSSGVTLTERVLADLCDRTFLKLWSYPNPYKADGKELCDVIAVFDNHIFLFFDRESRKFDDKNGDITIQWNRWYKNVIERQIKTSEGARRYIQENPTAVFLDSNTTVHLPIPLPTQNAVIHNIIVAHGAAEACKNFSPANISGSLAISYWDETNYVPTIPFHVTLSRTNPVHILDAANLEIILKELDTVYDFSAYLVAKEDAIKRYDVLSYCGEEDLLANYFQNFVPSTQKYFIGTRDSQVNGVMIAEGEWLSFIQKIEYKRRRDANRISELWDELLQRTTQNALDETLGGNTNVFKGKSAIFEMAKEPRVSRRTLSELMARSIRNFPGGSQNFMRNLSVFPSFYEKKAYVFLQVHHPNITDYDNEYRPKRQALLEIACGVVRNKYLHYETIIGIAIDAPKFSRRNAEDFILLNCKEWSVEDISYYEEKNKGFRFLETENLQKGIISSSDFPKNSNYYKASKIGRNDACPCGSGKKYKRCCLV